MTESSDSALLRMVSAMSRWSSVKGVSNNNPAMPTAGSFLFFDQTATRFVSTNNFPSGTSFASLDLIEQSPFTGVGPVPGYSISGNAIDVGEVSVYDAGVGQDSFQLNLTGSASLTKGGAGSLYLSGANTWSGRINLNSSSNIGVDGGTLTASGVVAGGLEA